MGHCPPNRYPELPYHFIWGTEKKSYSHSDIPEGLTINGIEIRKKLGNRKVSITFSRGRCDIFLYTKKRGHISNVYISEHDYKEKYENNQKSLLNLLELAEVFQ